LVAAVVYLVAFSPVLVVEDVVVTGADEQVASMARENADVAPGRPLARVDTEAVADRVAADTRIKTVEVSRGWPSSLTIAVTLREPRAVLTQPRRPPTLVDRSGVAYEAVATRPDELLRITAPRGSVARESLTGALQAHAALDQQTREEISVMDLTEDGELEFAVGSVTVVWGEPEGREAKAAAVRALLAQDGIDPESENALTIDVTAPRTPVVTGLSPAPPE